jgi:hypothetical protein
MTKLARLVCILLKTHGYEVEHFTLARRGLDRFHKDKLNPVIGIVHGVMTPSRIPGDVAPGCPSHPSHTREGKQKGKHLQVETEKIEKPSPWKKLNPLKSSSPPQNKKMKICDSACEIFNISILMG